MENDRLVEGKGGKLLKGGGKGKGERTDYIR